jgi:hypothetical protein
MSDETGVKVKKHQFPNAILAATEARWGLKSM